MAYSRFSVPFFAIFLVVIAVYMVYLIAVKNVLNISRFHYSESGESVFVEDTLSNKTQVATHHSFFDLKNIKKIISSKTKKIIMGPENKIDTSPKTVAAKNDSLAETNSTVTVTSTSLIQGALTNQAQAVQYSRNYELKLLWEKYNAIVPRLYSRPLSVDTEEKLGRVGQLSAGLDLLYQQDLGSWVLRVDETKEELIAIAVEGEREGARALSFQYFLPPLHKILESLTWAMIANAIAPNDYYLYICAEESSQCSEKLFEQASQQAKNYVDIYKFFPKK